MSWKKLVVLLVGLAFIAMLVPVGSAAATRYFSETRIVVGLRSPYPDSPAVWCPHGWHVTGGGWSLPPGTEIGRWTVKWSEPVVNSAHTQGWWASIVDNAPISHVQTFGVYANCAN